MVILTFYGLPLNIIRDVYLTARSFITRLRALVRYPNATRDMDRRYPDATEAELSAVSDRTCIICRVEMVSRVAQQAGAAQADAVQCLETLTAVTLDAVTAKDQGQVCDLQRRAWDARPEVVVQEEPFG